MMGYRVRHAAAGFLSFRGRAVVALLLVLGAAAASVHAQDTAYPYRDEIGFNRLKLELGAAMPTGAGIRVAQVEAGTDYIPDPNFVEFPNKNFMLQSGPSIPHWHPTLAVGRYLYGTESIGPGIRDIENWEASHWSGSGFLGNTTTAEPGASIARVLNHSWGDTYSYSANDITLARRYDYAIERSGYVTVAATMNGDTEDATVLAHSYNGIIAGRKDGDHGYTPSQFDVTGRHLVHLVVDRPYTSQSTPVIAASAALLLQTADAGGALVNARHNPETIKAILLAGATKNLPGWDRTPTRPLDEIYGLGMLNVYNSYHILTAGEQAASPTADVTNQGWDYADLPAGQAPRYTFEVPAGHVLNGFSAALTWNRRVADGNPAPAIWGDPTVEIANLDLRLVRLDTGGPETLVDSSVSTIENIEHVYRTSLPAGRYAMDISANFAGTTLTSTDYGLAWRGALEVIPEPATLALLAMGALAGLRRRR